MRTKIKVNGAWYKPVPWLEVNICTGCALDMKGCINGKGENIDACVIGGEFDGHIFIEDTPEALAQYVAKKLGADDEVPMD
jgi:hypothetical protein